MNRNFRQCIKRYFTVDRRIIHHAIQAPEDIHSVSNQSRRLTSQIRNQYRRDVLSAKFPSQPFCGSPRTIAVNYHSPARCHKGMTESRADAPCATCDEDNLLQS